MFQWLPQGVRTMEGKRVGMPSSEQVWTGLQWWPPDVSSGGGEGTQVPCQGVPYHVTYPMMHLMLLYPFRTDNRCPWKHYLPQTSFAGGNNQCLPPLYRYILVIATDKQEKTRPEMAFGDTFYLQFLSHLIGWETCGLRPEMTLHP